MQNIDNTNTVSGLNLGHNEVSHHRESLIKSKMSKDVNFKTEFEKYVRVIRNLKAKVKGFNLKAFKKNTNKFTQRSCRGSRTRPLKDLREE